MLPLLELIGDGREHTLVGAVDGVHDRMRIPAAEREEMLPSGTQTKLYNRVGWASFTLAQALLREKTGRRRFRITDRGRQALAEQPTDINVAFP